jgi:hypothetical protein
MQHFAARSVLISGYVFSSAARSLCPRWGFYTEFIPGESRTEGDRAMKKLIVVLAIVFLAEVAGAGQDYTATKHMKLVLARQSTVPEVDIMKNFSDRCPNVTITTNPQRSDYMLYAGGWSGEYRFMIIAKGGDTLYATKTVLLSNAVKDVCKFLGSRP